MGIIERLRKKHPQAAKLAKKFLDSECCDEDKNFSKSKKKKRKNERHL